MHEAGYVVCIDKPAAHVAISSNSCGLRVLLLTFDQCVLIYCIPSTDVDEYSVAAHASNGLCTDVAFCLWSAGKGSNHIVALRHQLVELVRGINLQNDP